MTDETVAASADERAIARKLRNVEQASASTPSTELVKRNVHEAILAVRAAIAEEGVGKDQFNSEQKFKFRGIDDVINALSPLLVEYRLNVLPTIHHKNTFEVGKTQRGAAVYRCTVEAEYTFTSIDDGTSLVVKAPGEAQDFSDKAVGKACSFAYKTAMIQAFCIPTEGVLEDPDAESPEAFREEQRSRDRGNGRGDNRDYDRGNDRGRQRDERPRSNDRGRDGGRDRGRDDRGRQDNRRDDRDQGRGQQRQERQQRGPTNDDLIDFVETTKTELAAFTTPDQFNDLLDYVENEDFVRRSNILRRMNRALHEELEHIISQAKLACDDVPF